MRTTGGTHCPMSQYRSSHRWYAPAWTCVLADLYMVVDSKVRWILLRISIWFSRYPLSFVVLDDRSLSFLVTVSLLSFSWFLFVSVFCCFRFLVFEYIDVIFPNYIFQVFFRVFHYNYDKGFLLFDFLWRGAVH